MADREGNTGAPKVEEREVRNGRASGYVPPEEERGTSWVSVVLGWLAALGAGLILTRESRNTQSTELRFRATLINDGTQEIHLEHS